MKFPTKKYLNIKTFSNDYFNNLTKSTKLIDLNSLDKICQIIEKKYKDKKRKVFVCGNGGSAALANHYACDHQKLLFETKKIKPKILSLCSNIPLISAIANDNGYEKIFEDQLKYNSKPLDLLIIISSSGNSKNIINALKWANKKNITTISFTGFNGGIAKKIANYNIHVPIFNYGIVEATHHSIMNIISQYIKNKLLSNNQIKKNIF
jgi:D-sedoheptulose 7-phosphate isomerase/D-glycero-D-manno-heptose 1,7-bisphosphate phosphatase